MKKYRVSGYIDEVGFCQVDVKAKDENKAKEIAINNYDFYKVLNVSELC